MLSVPFLQIKETPKNAGVPCHGMDMKTLPELHSGRVCV